MNHKPLQEEPARKIASRKPINVVGAEKPHQMIPARPGVLNPQHGCSKETSATQVHQSTDFFLRAWNSSAGETFRKALCINTTCMSTSTPVSELIQLHEVPNHGPITQGSFSHHCTFNSGPCLYQQSQSNALYQIDSAIYKRIKKGMLPASFR